MKIDAKTCLLKIYATGTVYYRHIKTAITLQEALNIVTTYLLTA